GRPCNPPWPVRPEADGRRRRTGWDGNSGRHADRGGACRSRRGLWTRDHRAPGSMITTDRHRRQVRVTVCSVPAQPLPELIDPGWAKALDPVADQVTAMGEFLRAEITAGRSYLPAGKHVLRAFTQPFDD